MTDADDSTLGIERETLVDALDTYGEDAQIEQTVEECAELIQALYGDGRDDVVDELADVRIMVAQMALLVGEDDVEGRTEEKMQRLRTRIGGECPEGEHDWRTTSPMFSDGWTRECDKCGKEDSVTR